jgi:hypothetical protein
MGMQPKEADPNNGFLESNDPKGPESGLKAQGKRRCVGRSA